MGDKSAIEWTDATWNPIRGCSRVSEGCRNCYAERTAVRHVSRRDPGGGDGSPGAGPYAGLVKSTPTGPRWTGEVRFVEGALALPPQWRMPRRIFVNSMSDLHHERVEVAWLRRITEVMIGTPRHTYQILTKRPERMRAWWETVAWHENGDPRKPLHRGAPPWVWLGVSVEDQPTLTARGPILAETPAAVRFISYEPALGRADFAEALGVWWNHTAGTWERTEPSMRTGRRWCDWLIAGGESGPGARPPHPDWFRSVRDQCVAASVPFFFKQWGEYGEVPKREDGPGRLVRSGDVVVTPDGRRAPVERGSLNCALEGEGIPMRRYGKKAAGHLLDGREWREFPA